MARPPCVGVPLLTPIGFRGRSRTWRQPLERCRFLANAPFVGLSVTLSRARLVAAPRSAPEARFDPATDKHNITDFGFLKEISDCCRRSEPSIWYPGADWPDGRLESTRERSSVGVARNVVEGRIPVVE
jgi:hypothetical protein